MLTEVGSSRKLGLQRMPEKLSRVFSQKDQCQRRVVEQAILRLVGRGDSSPPVDIDQPQDSTDKAKFTEEKA